MRMAVISFAGCQTSIAPGSVLLHAPELLLLFTMCDLSEEEDLIETSLSPTIIMLSSSSSSWKKEKGKLFEPATG